MKAIHTSTNTSITLHFISQRLGSWQLHLEEISCYLIEGEGAWWRTICTSEGVVFEFLDTHPKPQHYRTSDFKNMEAAKSSAWETIVNSDIPLPTPTIKLYDCNGRFKHTLSIQRVLVTCPWTPVLQHNVMKL